MLSVIRCGDVFIDPLGLVILSAFILGFTALTAIACYRWFLDQTSESNQLAKSVATEILAELSRDIEAKQGQLDQLDRDIRGYVELSHLKQRAREAVARILRAELRREGARSFRLMVLVTLGFFLLGVVATLLVTLMAGR